MSPMQLILGSVVFGAAFFSFLGVSLLVLTSHPGTRQAHLLIAALVMSVLWSGLLAFAFWNDARTLAWMPVIEALRCGLWVSFVVALLMSGHENHTARRMGIGILAVAGICVGSVVLTSFAAQDAGGTRITGGIRLGLLTLPLLGLFALEQVTRNCVFGDRRLLQPLAIGVGLIFMLDLFCYSQVFVSSGINLLTWEVRSIGNSIAAPFVLVAVKRQRDWERKLFLSRHVVFHTASLATAGVYLLALGLAGSFVGPFDGTGALLELAALVAASAVLVYALSSTRLRRRFKVFIAKHFYRNQYDYRQEWLRLIETLAGITPNVSISERGVRALAEIIESPSGVLWWADDGRSFEPSAGWHVVKPAVAIGQNSALARFLAASHWVIDTDEYRITPQTYEHAFEDDEAVLDPPSIYVPLVLEGQLRGIVRLDRRPDLGRLSFEDHDLLKTAGKQVAVFLAQERIQVRLAETKQFEAFSRLTTFLMHDLKNLISQQELVVGNAQRFKHKPEFIDDAIRTIESSVKRMRQVLERLQSTGSGESYSIIDLGRLLVEVVNACSDRKPMPEIRSMPTNLFVAMNKERLAMAVTHTIRNAQDATPPIGSIRVGVVAESGVAAIDIADTGVGMTAEFVRDRLFRPFDSTKGAQGMGIGAYQVRETLRAAGGEVTVESAPGSGTTFTLRLPLARRVEPELVVGKSGT